MIRELFLRGCLRHSGSARTSNFFIFCSILYLTCSCVCWLSPLTSCAHVAVTSNLFLQILMLISYRPHRT